MLIKQLRISASRWLGGTTQDSWVPSLVWVLSSPHTTQWLDPQAPQLLSLGVATTKTCSPSGPCSTIMGHLQWETHTPQLEKRPHSPQLEKGLSSNEDPAKPNIKKRKTSLRASDKGIYIHMVKASDGGISLVGDGKDSLRKWLV